MAGPAVAGKTPARRPQKTKAAVKVAAPKEIPAPDPAVISDAGKRALAQAGIAAPRDGEAFDPAYVAHRMRIAGQPWRTIADVCGYANDITACTAVTTYLQRAAMAMSKERAQEALALELDFLDIMKAEWFALGTVGLDDKAANVLLKISSQRTKLLELLSVDQASVASRTVVITGASTEYVANLRAIAEAPRTA